MALSSPSLSRSRLPMTSMRIERSTQRRVSATKNLRNRCISASISAGGRAQLDAEKACRVSVSIPARAAAATTAQTVLAPSTWPALRGNPRRLAQRPFPSMMIATCKWHSQNTLSCGVNELRKTPREAHDCPHKFGSWDGVLTEAASTEHLAPPKMPGPEDPAATPWLKASPLPCNYSQPR